MEIDYALRRAETQKSSEGNNLAFGARDAGSRRKSGEKALAQKRLACGRAPASDCDCFEVDLTYRLKAEISPS